MLSSCVGGRLIGSIALSMYQDYRRANKLYHDRFRCMSVTGDLKIYRYYDEITQFWIPVHLQSEAG